MLERVQLAVVKMSRLLAVAPAVRRALACGLCAWLMCASVCARAQETKPKTEPAAIEDILPLTNDPNDPIGLDAEQATLDRAAPSTPAKRGPAAPGSDGVDAKRFGPQPPAAAARDGEVLTAVQTVHLTAERASVELTAGMAIVAHELELESSSAKPAEAELRLAVPNDAALLSLSVCRAKLCRDALPDASADGELGAYDDALQARGSLPLTAALPLAHARVRAQAGAAPAQLVLRAAPVMLGEPLTLRVRYRVAAPVHGGVARVRLPGRGMDPRVAPIELSLHATDLDDARVDDRAAGATAVRIEPWSAVELSARARNGSKASAHLWRFACGAAQCLHAYVSAPAGAPEPVDAVLAIDASPSMEGPARSRLLTTLSAVLATMPRGSRVRALMFGGQASALVAEGKDPSGIALQAFGPATYDVELGSATRFESAWQMIEQWGWTAHARKKLVVLIGDGGLTTGPARPFAAARRAGVEVSAINLSDRAASSALAQGVALTRGTLIDAGSEAEAALHGLGNERIEERVAALYTREVIARVEARAGARHIALPALRAGESLSLNVALDSKSASSARLLLDGRTLHAEADAFAPAPTAALAAVDPRDLAHASHPGERPAGHDQYAKRSGAFCDRRGPALRHGGLSSDDLPVALARERARCTQLAPKPAPPPSFEEGAGMPGSPLLSMLRQRILPVARGCFRRDRAGRADYQVRAVFSFRLQDREVVSAEVQGQIEEALRQCLLAAVDTLAVPRFSGAVIVRYPLFTEREALPAQIELTASAADRVDTLLDPSKQGPH